jgi:hypothetical protein
LKDKIDLLDTFISSSLFPDLDPEERSLLSVQRNVMDQYYILLLKRIDLFDRTEQEGLPDGEE